MFDNLTFRVGLPVLYGIRDYLERKNPQGEFYSPKFLEQKLHDAFGKFIEDTPMNQRNSLWNKHKCVYCGNSKLPESGEGDFVVPKSRYKDIDLRSFTVPCCTICNISGKEGKGRKDSIEYWVDKLNRNIVELDVKVIGIFVRAEWKGRKKHETLNQNIPNYIVKAIKQEYEKIPNYKQKDIIIQKFLSNCGSQTTLF